MIVNLLKKIVIVFLGIIAMPLFGVLLIACSLAAVMSIVAGIIRTFGYTFIPMIWMGKDIPAAYSIPFSLLAALVCLILAFIGYKGLRYYLKIFKLSFSKT